MEVRQLRSGARRLSRDLQASADAATVRKPRPAIQFDGVIEIPAAAFNFVTVFLIGGDRARWRREYQRWSVSAEQIDAWCDHAERKVFPRGACTQYNPQCAPWAAFVYLKDFHLLPEDDQQGTIAHELTHLVFAVLQCKGVTLSVETEEVFAYLTEHLTREFWRRARA